MENKANRVRTSVAESRQEFALSSPAFWRLYPRRISVLQTGVSGMWNPLFCDDHEWPLENADAPIVAQNNLQYDSGATLAPEQVSKRQFGPPISQNVAHDRALTSQVEISQTRIIRQATGPLPVTRTSRDPGDRSTMISEALHAFELGRIGYVLVLIDCSPWGCDSVRYDN
jgi:hypothetical protein